MADQCRQVARIVDQDVLVTRAPSGDTLSPEGEERKRAFPSPLGTGALLPEELIGVLQILEHHALRVVERTVQGDS